MCQHMIRERPQLVIVLSGEGYEKLSMSIQLSASSPAKCGLVSERLTVLACRHLVWGRGATVACVVVARLLLDGARMVVGC